MHTLKNESLFMDHYPEDATVQAAYADILLQLRALPRDTMNYRSRGTTTIEISRSLNTAIVKLESRLVEYMGATRPAGDIYTLYGYAVRVIDDGLMEGKQSRVVRE